MPSLSQLGDSDAVENKYVDRVILYVEGEDDRNIFSFYLLQQYEDKIEIKTPSVLGGGGNSVINRVNQERAVNQKVFGIVDGDVLLTKGHLTPFKESFGHSDWIQNSEYEGIYFFPCWEMENVLYGKRILPHAIINLQPVKNLRTWTLRSIENGIIREAFRLSELAALNLALLERSYQTVKPETKTQIANRNELRREILKYIGSLDDADAIGDRYAEWRRFFRTLLPNDCDRDVIYKQFVSRVDGKALGIMLKKRFAIQRDIRSLLASNFSSDDQAMHLIDTLVKFLLRGVE